MRRGLGAPGPPDADSAVEGRPDPVRSIPQLGRLLTAEASSHALVLEGIDLGDEVLECSAARGVAPPLDGAEGPEEVVPTWLSDP